MRLRYIGNHDAVDAPDGQTVKRGQTADFAPALADRLLEQSVWKKVAPPKPRKPKPTTPAVITPADLQE